MSVLRRSPLAYLSFVHHSLSFSEPVERLWRTLASLASLDRRRTPTALLTDNVKECFSKMSCGRFLQARHLLSFSFIAAVHSGVHHFGSASLVVSTLEGTNWATAVLIVAVTCSHEACGSSLMISFHAALRRAARKRFQSALL